MHTSFSSGYLSLSLSLPPLKKKKTWQFYSRKQFDLKKTLFLRASDPRMLMFFGDKEQKNSIFI